MGDCRTFKVVLTRAAAPAALTRAAATPVASHAFDMTFGRAVGDEKKAQLSGNLRTNNTLDLNGARSDSEGVLEIKGYLSVKLFRAYAKAGALTALATSSYDLGLDAFGINLLGQQMAGAEIKYETPLMLAKAFNFPVFSIGFGPVSIGITAGVGGDVGVTPKITISAKQGGEASVPALANATSNGLLQVTFEPSAALTGNVTGGINLVIAKATLTATLQVLRIGFPVTGELRWGVTDLDMQSMMVRKLTVTGTLKWDLALYWLNVSLDAAGSLGPCPFCIGTTINIFKYENPAQTFTLLMRSLPNPIVLEAMGLPTPTGGPEGTPTPTGDIPATPTDGSAATPTPTPEVAAPTDTPAADAPTPTPEGVATPPEGGLLVSEAATTTPTATPTPTVE
jgi:hypothetical protein